MRPATPQEKRALVVFGATVRSRRDALALSQEELAHRCRVSPAYISGIENGARNISLINLMRVAKGLETTPASLLDDSAA